MGRPGNFSINMYSEPTGFSSIAYPSIRGVGMPCARTKSIVATSLATAKRHGIVDLKYMLMANTHSS